ncbi:MAG: helix-turn-helix domain-containing protein [Pseudomonadota bacterium]
MSAASSQTRHTANDRARGVTAADGSSKARFERAALTLFTERSIEQVTTKEIAAAAGLSEGLLYRYAKSKNDLAADMFFAIHAQLGGLVRDIGVRPTSLEEKASNLVAAYAQCADDDWVLFSYHLLNTHRFLTEDRSVDNPVAATEGILQAAIDDGELPDGEVTLLAAMVLGVVLQPALHKAFGRLTGTLQSYSPAITKGVLAILLDHRGASHPGGAQS